MRRIPFFRRIRFKLTIAFLIPIVFIIILGYASFEKASEGIIQSYETSVNQTMQMMNEYLSLIFNTVQSNYKSYIDDNELLKYYKGLYDSDSAMLTTLPKQYTTTFHNHVTGDSMISNIYVISDAKENIGTGTFAGEDLYARYLESEQGVMAQENKYSFFIYGHQSNIDEGLGVSSSNYGARLVRYMNGINAILMIDINKSYVEDTLSLLDGGDNSYTALVTCDGVEYIKSASGETLDKLFTDTEFYQKALASEESEGSEYVIYQGRQYLFLYSCISGRDAMICSLIPEENVIAQVADIKQITVQLIILAAVVAIGLGFIIAGSYGKTINGIVGKLAEVGKGDLTVSVTTKKKDEFLLLADGISDMIANMKQLLQNVTEVSNELSQAAGWVNTSSNTFIETSDGIKQAIQEIETGTSRLDTDSAECLDEMDLLSEKIEFVSENASSIRSLTAETENAIHIGMDSMEDLNKSAASTTRITGEVITAIQELEEKSRSIGQIIKTINNISEETNLLSLNASVEAARAGEAGRGFAVVAEQIKKLADQSMESSAEIERIVEEIVNRTKQVVEVAREAENIVKEQETAVSYTTGSFREIDEKVTSLMESLVQINQNVNNMEEARENTLAAITSISAVSAETASGSTTVYEAADRQTNTVGELEEAARKLAARSAELTNLLHEFRL